MDCPQPIQKYKDIYGRKKAALERGINQKNKKAHRKTDGLFSMLLTAKSIV